MQCQFLQQCPIGLKHVKKVQCRWYLKFQLDLTAGPLFPKTWLSLSWRSVTQASVNADVNISSDEVSFLKKSLRTSGSVILLLGLKTIRAAHVAQRQQTLQSIHALQLMLAFCQTFADKPRWCRTFTTEPYGIWSCIPGLLGNGSSWHPAIKLNSRWSTAVTH